jgi:hypothetical protein
LFLVFGCFPLVFGLVSSPPGHILESVFLWRVSVDRNLLVCYVIVLPSRRSGFRAGFQPDSNREGLRIGLSAGRRADFEVFPTRVRPKSGPEARFPVRKQSCVTSSGTRPLLLPSRVLTWTQGQILDFSFSVPQIRSPGLIFVDLCSVGQAGAVGQAPGPNLGRKPAKKPEKLKYIFEFPVLSPSKCKAR